MQYNLAACRLAPLPIAAALVLSSASAAWPDLPDQAGTLHRALRGGFVARYRRAALGRSADPTLGPTSHRRQSCRRCRDDRRRVRGQGAARRSHTAPVQHRLERHLGVAVCKGALRSDARLRTHYTHRDDAEHDLDAPLGADQVHQTARRLRARQSRQVELLVRFARRLAAALVRVAQAQDQELPPRRQHPVQGRGTGSHRHHRRADSRKRLECPRDGQGRSSPATCTLLP